MRIESIQKHLRQSGLDGWLFFDHHQRDPLAYRILGFQPPRSVTRRWYYFVPAQGEPRKLVHRIEAQMPNTALRIEGNIEWLKKDCHAIFSSVCNSICIHGRCWNYRNDLFV